MIRFVSWDHNGGPQIAELKAAIERFPRGPLYVHEISDGSSDYVMAITDLRLTRAAVQAAYEDQ